MATPRYDKNSCLAKLQKYMIEERDICSKCLEIRGKTKSKLLWEKIEWKGICKRLQNGFEASQVSNEEVNNENVITCHPCRPRRKSASQIDRYDPAPTRKMFSTYSQPPPRRPPSRPPLQPTTGNQMHQMMKKDRSIRKQFYQDLAQNQRLSLPGEGQSKPAKSRRKQTTLQVAVAAMKDLHEPHLPSAEKERRVLEALGGGKTTLAEIFEEARESKARQQARNDDSPTEAMEVELDQSARNDDSTTHAMEVELDQSSKESTTDAPTGTKRNTSSACRRSRKKRRSTNESEEEKDAKKVQQVKEILGTELINQIKKMERPKHRRPFLALVGNLGKGVGKKYVEQATGIKICKEEWNQIQMHAKYPGPLKPVKPKVIQRNRIQTEHLQALLAFLSSPEKSQRYAFGNKLMAISGGWSTVTLDNVSLRGKIDDAVAEYLQELTKEMAEKLGDDPKLPDEEERCERREKKGANCRCRKKKEHKGRCQFTRKGGMSYGTCLALAKSLCGNEIKKLAGLDDVKVVKGRNNWLQAKELIDALYPKESEKGKRLELTERIEKQEAFYVTDYIPHLSRESNNKCNCLTCGFCEEGSDISCPKRDQHGPSCTRCSDGFAVFQELQEKIAEKETELKNSPTMEPLDLQNLYQHRTDVENCIENLRAYRGHLARHTAEEEFALKEYNELEDSTAIITSDYKMKILANYFRENQHLWFGKRGTTCLGFMIVTNPADEELKSKGIKDVRFAMMITPDGTQDDWAVACGKSFIYEQMLPSHIKKVIFAADGAGCFKSRLHRAIQGFWKYWTGIDETVLRISPAGDGKTELDGMFGRMSTVLDSAIVKTNSYYHDWRTILKVLGDSNGLNATDFVGYKPDRTNQLEVEIEEGQKFSSSFLTSFKQSDCLSHSKTLCKIFKHTGYGSGVEFSCSSFKFLPKNDEEDDNDEDDGNKRSTLGKKANGKKAPKNYIQFYDPDTGILDLDVLERYKPSWTDLVTTTNKKSGVSSVVSRPGEGANSKEGREKRRQKRVVSKSNKLVAAANQDLEDARKAGLFPCGARCPQTGHFCRKIFKKENNLQNHIEKGRCEFPTMNARTFTLYHASKPGGALENGSRSNRKSKTLSEPILPATENSLAEIAARCYQGFNRSDKVEPDRLTDGQLAFLLRMYGSKTKKNPKEIHALMKQEIDPVCGGLMFCPPKAKMETNGSLLAESTITSWISRECANRKKKKPPAGTARVGSLSKHLETLIEHKLKHPTAYWKVVDDKGKPMILTGVATSFLAAAGVGGASKMNKMEKIKAILELSFDRATFDNNLELLRRRKEMLTSAIGVSRVY